MKNKDVFESWERIYYFPYDIKIVHRDGDLGTGLLARRDIKKGQIIFKDKPIVAMQNIFSQRICLSCHNCFRIIGSINQAIHWIFNENDQIPPDQIEYSKKEYIEELPTPIPCPRHCGAYFCSYECFQEASTYSHHRILCNEANSNQIWYWKQFLKHAKFYHENFILAGITFFKVLMATKYNHTAAQDFMDEFNTFHSSKWELLNCPSKIKTKHSNLLEDVDSRYTIMKESFTLLKQCINEFWNSNPIEFNQKIFKDMLSLEFYSQMLATFDLVNLDIEIQHPFSKLTVEHVTKNKNIYQKMHQIINAVDSNMEENDLAEYMQEIFPPFMGIGLYRCVALTNHSCVPNAEIDFLHNYEAHIKAIEDIPKDDEIFISYINEDLPLNDRYHLLKHLYNFVCKCKRCTLEAYKQILIRRNLLPTNPYEIEELLSKYTKIPREEIRKISRDFG